MYLRDQVTAYPPYLHISRATDIKMSANKLHEAQQRKKAEEEVVVVAEKENVASIQAKAFAKSVDDTIVPGIIIVLTNTGVMDETPEESNIVMADEVEHNVIEPTSKQSKTSNVATSRDKGEPDAIIVTLPVSASLLSTMHNPPLSLEIKYKI
ncbi:hypothetical protein JHK87_009913 [Glycine soja]|nr:hypothetical protein JHK87_009913 [Glycine soja]